MKSTWSGLCRTMRHWSRVCLRSTGFFLLALGLVFQSPLFSAENVLKDKSVATESEESNFADSVEAEIIDAMFSLASGYFPNSVSDQEAAPVDPQTFGKQTGEDSLTLGRGLNGVAHSATP